MFLFITMRVVFCCFAPKQLIRKYTRNYSIKESYNRILLNILFF